MSSATATPSTPAPAALAPCDKLTGATNTPQTVTAAALAWFAAWEDAEYPNRPASAPPETLDECDARWQTVYAAGDAVVAAPSESHADLTTKQVYWALDNEDTAPNCMEFAHIVEEARKLVDPVLREPIERRELADEMRRRIYYLPKNDPWDGNDVFFRRFGGLRRTPTAELRSEVARLQKRAKGRRRRYATHGPNGKLVSR